MRIDDGLAPVEFLEYRREHRITEPLVAVACEQCDAVGLEHIEAVLDLAQAAVDVRHRQCGEYAEAAGVISNQTRRVVVAFAGQTHCVRGVKEGIARRRDRSHGRGYAGAIHVFQRLRSGPTSHCAEALGAQRLNQTRRREAGRGHQ